MVADTMLHANNATTSTTPPAASGPSSAHSAPISAAATTTSSSSGHGSSGHGHGPRLHRHSKGPQQAPPDAATTNAHSGDDQGTGAKSTAVATTTAGSDESQRQVSAGNGTSTAIGQRSSATSHPVPSTTITAANTATPPPTQRQSRFQTTASASSSSPASASPSPSGLRGNRKMPLLDTLRTRNIVDKGDTLAHISDADLVSASVPRSPRSPIDAKRPRPLSFNDSPLSKGVRSGTASVGSPTVAVHSQGPFFAGLHASAAAGSGNSGGGGSGAQGASDAPQAAQVPPTQPASVTTDQQPQQPMLSLSCSSPRTLGRRKPNMPAGTSAVRTSFSATGAIDELALSKSMGRSLAETHESKRLSRSSNAGTSGDMDEHVHAAGMNAAMPPASVSHDPPASTAVHAATRNRSSSGDEPDSEPAVEPGGKPASSSSAADRRIMFARAKGSSFGGSTASGAGGSPSTSPSLPVRALRLANPAAGRSMTQLNAAGTGKTSASGSSDAGVDGAGGSGSAGDVQHADADTARTSTGGGGGLVVMRPTAEALLARSMNNKSLLKAIAAAGSNTELLKRASSQSGLGLRASPGAASVPSSASTAATSVGAQTASTVTGSNDPSGGPDTAGRRKLQPRTILPSRTATDTDAEDYLRDARNALAGGIAANAPDQADQAQSTLQMQASGSNALASTGGGGGSGGSSPSASPQISSLGRPRVQDGQANPAAVATAATVAETAATATPAQNAADKRELFGRPKSASGSSSLLNSNTTSPTLSPRTRRNTGANRDAAAGLDTELARTGSTKSEMFKTFRGKNGLSKELAIALQNALEGTALMDGPKVVNHKEELIRQRARNQWAFALTRVRDQVRKTHVAKEAFVPTNVDVLTMLAQLNKEATEALNHLRGVGVPQSGLSETERIKTMARIIRVPWELRTEAQSRSLFNMLGQLPAFSRFSANVRQELLKYVKFDELGPGRIIIKSGQMCMSCYVIVVGSCIAKADHQLDSAGVPIVAPPYNLTSGASFGEFSLSSDSDKRTVTVTSLTTCFLLRFERDDFKKVMLKYANKELNARVTFLRTVLAFEDTPDDVLQALSRVLQPLTIAPDAVIVEGGAQDFVYFVKNGQVKVFREIPFLKDLSAAEASAVQAAASKASHAAGAPHTPPVTTESAHGAVPYRYGDPYNTATHRLVKLALAIGDMVPGDFFPRLHMTPTDALDFRVQGVPPSKLGILMAAVESRGAKSDAHPKVDLALSLHMGSLPAGSVGQTQGSPFLQPAGQSAKQQQPPPPPQQQQQQQQQQPTGGTFASYSELERFAGTLDIRVVAPQRCECFRIARFDLVSTVDEATLARLCNPRFEGMLGVDIETIQKAYLNQKAWKDIKGGLVDKRK
ncbi:hypothetical protein BC831DRAFT_463338 [Entophlyctis helioformis]|nr:hypothetical protein BC831DRAFT_463338 [Entophlyctis helioformis]